MAKFASDRFPPGFFDLPIGAGETLPLDIIERWTRGAQTRERALAILAPHTLHGTVVSSDASGLTRLSRERPLVQILAMINRPKELVHAWGVAIGGRALSVWAADNTQMFYPPDVSGERLLAMLLATLDQIAKECEITIGLCAHRGAFFALGNGVYGPDADRVEIVAEDHTEGGEILITDTLAATLAPSHGFGLSPRTDLSSGFGAILRVTGGPRISDVTPSDFKYPLPYTDGFYQGLSTYTRTRRDSQMPRPIYDESAVVLIEREGEETDIPEVAVLNDLALAAAMTRIGGTLLHDLHGAEIKTSGRISIYTFQDCRHAVEFAEGFRRELKTQGIACRIGVDVGQVLEFDLGGGAWDIAGSPVNIASKLAQDVGEFGTIYVTQTAAQKAGVAGGKEIRFEVSGVSVAARAL
jgi:hypothetical protein